MRTKTLEKLASPAELESLARQLRRAQAALVLAFVGCLVVLVREGDYLLEHATSPLAWNFVILSAAGLLTTGALLSIAGRTLSAVWSLTRQLRNPSSGP